MSSQQQIDPEEKTSGAMAVTVTGWEDAEWVYLERRRRGKGVVPALEEEDGDDGNYKTNEGQLEKVYESDEDTDDGDDSEGSGSDEEDYLSDYSNERRLEKGYESDEHLDDVAVAEEEDDDDDYEGSSSDEEDDEDDDSEGSGSDDEEDCVSDYSREGRLEEGHESDEGLDEVTEEAAAAADGVADVDDVLIAAKAATDGSFSDLADSLNDDDVILARAKTDAYLAGYRHGRSVGRRYGFSAGGGGAYGYNYNGDVYHGRLLQSPLYQPYHVLGVGMYTPPYPHYYMAAAPLASPFGGYYSSYIPPPYPAAASSSVLDWWLPMF